MTRTASRAAALVVALACMAWPLAPALALPCGWGAAKCSLCTRSKAKARAVSKPRARCCIEKATGRPLVPTVKPAPPRVDLAPAPALPVLTAPVRELPLPPREPRSLPPRVLQRTHPLLR